MRYTVFVCYNKGVKKAATDSHGWNAHPTIHQQHGLARVTGRVGASLLFPKKGVMIAVTVLLLWRRNEAAKGVRHQQVLFYGSQWVEPLASLPKEAADARPSLRATVNLRSLELWPYLMKEGDQNWRRGNKFEHYSPGFFLGAVWSGLCQNPT